MYSRLLQLRYPMRNIFARIKLSISLLHNDSISMEKVRSGKIYGFFNNQ